MLRARLLGPPLLAFLLALGVLAVTAAACEGGGSGGKELTSLSTTLSGEGKEGEEITVAEGAKVKDKATLTGKNASKATGKVKYKIYSEKECKTLVKEAGEVTVSGESVPASSEEELEAGKSYYWQAHYGGDEKNDESTSPCTEVLKVQAKTSLSTKLSGGGEEGEEITVNEGTKVKDKATLTGTNSSSAEGKVLYKVFSDKECKTLVKEAGEESVSGGSVTASSEEELEGGKTYYWQATYKGDSLHKESTSSCGSEVLKVKAKTTLATKLSGSGEEGEEITINEGAKAKDKATVEGTNSSSAEGKVLYKVYSDNKCEHLVAEAGEKSVSSGAGTASSEEELEGAATYYWQATYKGDSLHQESKSICGKEVLTVKAKTTLSTALSGESKEGDEITVLEGAKVKDKATLGGSHSSSAEGKVAYKVYSDKECKDLVTSAGEETVSSGSVPASSEEELEGGKTYYWQATYKGDSLHEESTSECGKEILKVKAKTTLTTTLSGEGKEGTELTVLEGAKVKDAATLGGGHSSSASGEVVYKIYSDKECKTLIKEAGEVTVTSGSVPASTELELEGGKTYYWQATYKGDSLHQESTSSCGSETLDVKIATSLTTTLSAGELSAPELEIDEGEAMTDAATLDGLDAAMAEGSVTYYVYSNSSCTHLVAEAGSEPVTAGLGGTSLEETLPRGTYYWQAVYSGDAEHAPATSECGTEIGTVDTPEMTTSLSSGSQSGEALEVLEGKAVRDTATLGSIHAAEATGTVRYKIYSDSKCEHLVTNAGEVAVSGATAPASTEETLSLGTYYWQAEYTGDAHNPTATSACGTEVSVVTAETSLTTSLSGEGHSGAEIEVEDEAPVTDAATLSGPDASEASGTVEYRVFSDDKCEHLVSDAGTVEVSKGVVPASEEEELAPGTYYWQATYSGDGTNHSAESPCGSEVTIVNPGSLTAVLSSGERTGEEIDVEEYANVRDSAKRTIPHPSEVSGEIEYAVYSNSECTELVTSAGHYTISNEPIPSSEEESLPTGIYCWKATFKGEGGSWTVDTEETVEGGGDKYAALGDSFSSGLGVNREFYPATTIPPVPPTPEDEANLCYRSKKAWPVLVAEARSGNAVAGTNTIFEQQPPAFIFRACQAALIENLWNKKPPAEAAKSGQYPEWVSNGAGSWFKETPAQTLWLQEPGGVAPATPIKPNKKIALVTLTIGGNDAGFGFVGQNCVNANQGIGLASGYSAQRCKEVIQEWETGRAGTPNTLIAGRGIPSIAAKLEVVLKYIRESAPNAKIRVPLYPEIIDSSRRGNIAVGTQNVTLRGRAIRNVQFTIQGEPAGENVVPALKQFFDALNDKIADTVKSWAKKMNLWNNRKVTFIAGTQTALAGHELGDQPNALWVNGVLTNARAVTAQEVVNIASFHPNCEGNKSLAQVVTRALGLNEPAGWRC